jgi:polysaccharide chain length determinant protein (PEP-CTERM system associated)
MEDTHVHALDYLSVLRRRKWWLLVPIIASVGVGAALVRYLPKQYKASATVAVVAAGVSPNLVVQSAPFDNEERLRAVSQQLLSPAVLTRVAREQGLSSNPDDALIRRLRAAVSIAVPDPVATTNEPRRFDTFIVAYADADPLRAQQVTNRLASAFVDENSKTRERRAEHTSSFIASQLAASQTRLDELDARLRRAKESHIGQLPEQTQANLQTLSGLRQQLDSNVNALRGEQDRISMIERQLAAMTPGASDAAGTAGAHALPTPGGLESGPEARALALQRELATARLAYTDKHPDVVRLSEELAKARTEAAAEHQRPVSDRIAQAQFDPAYRQLSTERETARLRVRELERGSDDLRRQITLYQARVESAPMVEQELTSVQRDYDLEKLQYAELSAKLRAATTAEHVERDRTGEQFSVLYPAVYPSEPSKPIPLRVMLLALVGGLCVGVGLMLGREYFDRSVHDVRELRDELDLSVLGEVNRIKAA